MKAMKYLLIVGIFSFLIVLTSCNKASIHCEKTVILEIESSVTPTITSNFGEGQLDETQMKYTHKISYIKDLYIYLSYDNFKTESVYISTEEMNDDVITKQVSFGNELDAEIEITVEGVKTLEGLEIASPSDYSDLEIVKKNTFRFKVPSRDESLVLSFELPNYKQIDIEIDKENLSSGSYKTSVPVAGFDEFYVGFKGIYNYIIYDADTDEVVKTEYINYSNKITYAVLSNDKDYYVELQDHFYNISLQKINSGENFVFEAEYLIDNEGYTEIITDFSNNGLYIYNKNLNIMLNRSDISLNPIDNFGILFYINDSFYYCDNLESCVSHTDGYYTNLDIKQSDLSLVDVDITRINVLTNQVIESGAKELFFEGYVEAQFENNKFEIKSYEMPYSDLLVEFYDKNTNELIDSINLYISQNYNGRIQNGIIFKDDRPIPYRFPIFLEDLVCGEDGFEKLIVKIDPTEYCSVYVENEEGYSSDAYLIDEDGNYTSSFYSEHKTYYFKLEAGKEYILYCYSGTYEFTPTLAEIESGRIVL